MPTMQPRAHQVAGASAQMDLFIGLDAVMAAYSNGAEVSNEAMYERVRQTSGIDADQWEQRAPVGRAGASRCLAERRARWHQQTLRDLGIIERVPGKRGVWRLVAGKEQTLTPAPAGVALLAYSTRLGLALWSDCAMLQRVDEPIALCVTSPPYPLRQPRAYGNPTAQDFSDFITVALEPVVRTLLPGGSIALNLSNDIFEPGSPARSLYLERLTISLHERLGLQLMDRLVWHNPSKPPGPMQWASRTRQQLNVGYEPVLWFTNDPKACFADNRRVLQPHSERHARFVAMGGHQHDRSHSDGAYRKRPGAYGKPTAGKIPKNVLSFAHQSQEAMNSRQKVRAASLPVHGAPFPLGLAKFLVQFLSRPGDLVLDIFSGWNTTGLACELTGRRWLAFEKHAQYAAGGSFRFESFEGFERCFELQAST